MSEKSVALTETGDNCQVFQEMWYQQYP